ncbi:MAG: glycosyltransferase [Bacteroidaceae bacterium]|nr:glycosyltransferase [Bacteroidaceae bacterium]MBR5884988.1 glycosyltransferase [Bacteroidaceae bacterium]
MSDGQKSLSVIVPVYRVEDTLERCVESLLEQDCPSMEIILVDDGSPDRCPQLCDAWAVRDSRIRVLHKPNGGLSDAGNAGIGIAAGDYLTFVDSDDYLSHGE